MNNERDHKGQRRGGLYVHPENGKPYLSVTTALSVIDKPALRYWYGNEIYNAMVANPALTRQEAHSAPYKTSDKAKQRGSTVHSIVEAIKHGTELEIVTPEFQPYLNAFRQFMADFQVDLLEQERTVYSQEGYAGTLDLLIKTRGLDKPVVADVKTGKGIYPEAFLQTSAYRQALTEQGTQTAGTGVILLRENGSYVYEYQPRTDRHYRGFLASKTLYEATHEDDLTKMGYFDAWGGER